MKDKSLKEIIDFTVGINSSRIANETADRYSLDDFDNDLLSINSTDDKSGCIISLVKTSCAPLSKETAKKIVTANYIKCDFDINVLDPWYFSYIFNESKHFEKKLQKQLQSITRSVKRINIGNIADIKISLPDIKLQRKLGEMYKISLSQERLMIKKANDIKKLTLNLIEIIEEAENGR